MQQLQLCFSLWSKARTEVIQKKLKNRNRNSRGRVFQPSKIELIYAISALFLSKSTVGFEYFRFLVIETEFCWIAKSKSISSCTDLSKLVLLSVEHNEPEYHTLNIDLSRTTVASKTAAKTTVSRGKLSALTRSRAVDHRWSWLRLGAALIRLLSKRSNSTRRSWSEVAGCQSV